MNRVARMMLMANRPSEENIPRYESQRPNYRYYDDVHNRGGYEMEDRYRDRRGREHYDNGRYAPQSVGDYDVEGRGRYDRVDRDGDVESRHTGNVYPMRASYETPRRKIGFSIGGEMERLPDNNASRMMSDMPFTRPAADEWVSRMQNSDGSTGPHWSFDQAKQLMAQRKIDCDPVRFYAALNAVYSDFGAVAKKHGVSNVEFFADLAKAWPDDKDAVSDKLEKYYEYIVKR